MVTIKLKVLLFGVKQCAHCGPMRTVVEKAVAAVNKDGFTYRGTTHQVQAKFEYVAADKNEARTDKYRVGAFPTTFIIHRGLKLRRRIVGAEGIRAVKVIFENFLKRIVNAGQKR